MNVRTERTGSTFQNWLALTLVVSWGLSTSATRGQTADETPVPHGQQKPPGPALSPEDAVRRMTVPPGFSVEIVACEPDLVNPVAMTFDERGRIWVTESLEYPRREKGPGRDRVKILEDTDQDGRVDRVQIFADGLNIPSGIAVGAGGVWVANSPDILFLRDTDGDDRADTREVIVTGFGRDDTHELPNSLTWGPDGWLYGLNGVFNPATVEHQGRRHEFTCALFRIHPPTHAFELFAEGTSNPWGVAFDGEGSAFVSACVIDHLWHLAETGYYHRQGGPYPPFTWKIESIVGHQHQQAAYCGIHYFDSAAYPPEYRDKLYMGNIHGNCLNVDELARDGATYAGSGLPDFLSAHDAWFMPVVQKTGPDGCLYVLDWYDRYHCYQDANRDPEGIDRGKGRLYRIRYQDTPRAKSFDLARASADELVEYLHSDNGYFRDLAQRRVWEVSERFLPGKRLEELILTTSAPRKARLHALWGLIGRGPPRAEFLSQLLAHPDATFRAWAVRAAGNAGKVPPGILTKILDAAHDNAPDVRLQVAIAARKLADVDPLTLLLAVLDHSQDDPLIPHIVWQNLHPLLEGRSDQFLSLLEEAPAKSPGWVRLLPRVTGRLIGARPPQISTVVRLLELVAKGDPVPAEIGAQSLAMVSGSVQTGEISAAQVDGLREGLRGVLDQLLEAGPAAPLYLDAALLATSLADRRGLSAVRSVLQDVRQDEGRRLQALEALVAADDSELLAAINQILSDRIANPVAFRRRTLEAVGRLSLPEVAQVVLAHYPAMEPDLQPQVIELLTSRAAWSRELMSAIRRRHIPSTVLNLNQVRKLLASDDAALVEDVRGTWGSLRTERDPAREQVIAAMRPFLRNTPGDPHAGQAVFKKVCGQCHKLHGEGQEVGPDITKNGRSSFDQLLSNVFDPSLVIGAAFQARTVITTDGRVLTGLVTEDSDARVILTQQGGKQEVVPRDQIDEMAVSRLSLMPEDLEKQLQPQELADLFALLTLDKPPSDPSARHLSGFLIPQPREASQADEFPGLVGDVAPGFTLSASGEGGIAILAEHSGREGVLRTHPVSEEVASILAAKIAVPFGQKTRLLIDAAHDPNGDWRLVVRAAGKEIYDGVVGSDTTDGGWLSVDLDLTEFAGQQIDLEVANQANGWSWEFGYWGRVEVVSD